MKCFELILPVAILMPSENKDMIDKILTIYIVFEIEIILNAAHLKLVR